MVRRAFFISFHAVALLAVAARLDGARAIDVQCVEASKYKYLMQIFDNDRKKFSDFLGVPSAQLPDGEMCRAILVTGPIDVSAKARKAGQPDDFSKLLAAIADNRGSLSTVYLASSGGSIGMGIGLAQLTRLFWLKTAAPNAKSFVYQPDFFGAAMPLPAGTPLSSVEVPPEFAKGWSNYARAVEQFQPVTVTTGAGRCASACTYPHVAGIDRSGTVFVHRGRFSKAGDQRRAVDVDRSMADVLEGLQRAEAKVVALYRSMDSGDEFVRLFQATPTATITPASTDRFPRYVSDLLRAKCRGDAVQMQGQEQTLRAALAGGSGAEQTVDPAKLRIDLALLQHKRAKTEQCIVAAHEKERLAQFQKFCAGGCDRRLVIATARSKVDQLVPPPAQSPFPQRAR